MPPVWNFVYANPHASYSTELFTKLAVTISNVAYDHWENGMPVYRVWFEYGTTTGYGKTVEANCNLISSGDGSDDWESAKFPSLKGVAYHFRVKVDSGGCIGYSDDFTFTAPVAVSGRLATLPPGQGLYKGKVLVGATGFEAYFVYFEHGNNLLSLDRETDPVYIGAAGADTEFTAARSLRSAYYRAMVIVVEEVE